MFDRHTARKLIRTDAKGGIKWSKIGTLVLPFQSNCSPKLVRVGCTGIKGCSKARKMQKHLCHGSSMLPK